MRNASGCFAASLKKPHFPGFTDTKSTLKTLAFLD
jgi:hypothetical protein